MSIVKYVFITGANRGIGFHLLKKIVPEFKPVKVFATFRDPEKSKELHEFAGKNPNVQLIQFDLRDFDKYDDLAKTVQSSVGENGLNLLVNNSGITSKVAKITAARKNELMETFEVNTVAPIMLTKALLPSLEKATTANQDAEMGISRAAVINMSSILGSIQANDQGGMYSYRCSKAALNAATKSMSLDFKKSKILAVSIHPGWVRTDMGGPKAPLTPDEATAGIVSLLKSLESKHNGGFYQYDGHPVAW